MVAKKGYQVGSVGIVGFERIFYQENKGNLYINQNMALLKSANVKPMMQ